MERSIHHAISFALTSIRRGFLPSLGIVKSGYRVQLRQLNGALTSQGGSSERRNCGTRACRYHAPPSSSGSSRLPEISSRYRSRRFPSRPSGAWVTRLPYTACPRSPTGLGVGETVCTGCCFRLPVLSKHVPVHAERSNSATGCHRVCTVNLQLHPGTVEM
jgi:hypothetical protein